MNNIKSIEPESQGHNLTLKLIGGAQWPIIFDPVNKKHYLMCTTTGRTITNEIRNELEWLSDFLDIFDMFQKILPDLYLVYNQSGLTPGTNYYVRLTNDQINVLKHSND